MNVINPVDSIVVQLNNNRSSNHQNADKLINAKNNSVQLNLDVNEDVLTRAVEKVNELYKLDNKRMEYEFRDELNTVVIRIIDTKTDEVIKQIPNQKLLDYAAGLMEFIGLTIDTKV